MESNKYRITVSYTVQGKSKKGALTDELRYGIPSRFGHGTRVRIESIKVIKPKK